MVTGQAMRPCVLVVDDDPDTLEIIDLALGDRYRFLMTTEAESALEILELEDVDLMLVDYRMPGMSGVALLERARERQIDVPCLLLSALPVALPSAGFTTILEKPCSVAELRGALDRALEGLPSRR